MKKRILFVDDQPELLRGIRRLFFEMGDVWELEFVETGQKALEILQQDQVDVIISDMRMPGMDGAELLLKVKEKFPSVLRIVLSGHSDQEMIFKSIGAAHQFLAKPLEGEKLKEVLSRAFALRDLLQDPDLKTLAADLKSLPSMPNLYQELISQLQAPDVSMTRLGETISKDVAMTAKIMQLVNSAFFGLPMHVSDPVHAAKLLGPDIIKALVLSVQVFSKFDHAKSKVLSIDEFTDHSLSVASVAQKIALHEKQDKQSTDNAFIAGMVHDIGKLILAENLTEEFDSAVTLATTKGLALWEAEQSVIGATHGEVGAYLLGLWGLPEGVVEAVAFHHVPTKSTEEVFTPLTAVHVADGLYHRDGGNGNGSGAEIDSDYLKKLSLADRLPQWQQYCQ